MNILIHTGVHEGGPGDHEGHGDKGDHGDQGTRGTMRIRWTMGTMGTKGDHGDQGTMRIKWTWGPTGFTCPWYAAWWINVSPPASFTSKGTPLSCTKHWRHSTCPPCVHVCGRGEERGRGGWRRREGSWDHYECMHVYK